MNLKISYYLLFAFMPFVSYSQIEPERHLMPKSETSNSTDKLLKFDYKQLILPSIGIVYGIVGIENHTLRFINGTIQHGLGEHIDRKLSIDDFSQYAPAACGLGLDIFGLNAKHSLKQRSIALTCSYIIMTAVVLSLKYSTKIERPDKTSFNSFPSGHTSTAFAGAEFLWQEYKDHSIWIGIAGYTIATGTGVFRMLNNRHWLTDIATGAGIGMLSTKLAYWLYPGINRTLFRQTQKSVGMGISPDFSTDYFGIKISISII